MVHEISSEHWETALFVLGQGENHNHLMRTGAKTREKLSANSSKGPPPPLQMGGLVTPHPCRASVTKGEAGLGLCAD